MADQIGFVGLGHMGARMATRMISAGRDVVVWSRDPRKVAVLAGAGARPAADPQAVAQMCDVVLGCLLDDAAVQDVYVHSGILAEARAGQVFVEHGTFSPGLARRMADLAARRGAAFLDAPVTGGPEGAETGTLVAMVGGDASALDSIRPALETCIQNIEHIGPSGSGLQLKVVNQLLVSIHMAAAAEAAALLASLEIPLEKALPVLQSGWAASAMLGRQLPRALSGAFENAGAAIGGLIAVQELIAACYQQAGIVPRVLPAVRELFNEAVVDGRGDQDPSALVALYASGSRR